jgi:hypothetical protein
MSESVVDTLSKLGLPALEKLQAEYVARADTQGAEMVRSAIGKKGHVQTAELFNSGQLFHQRNYDPDTGRITHTYTGDPKTWMREYESQGASGYINRQSCTGANSQEAKELRASQVTVTLKPGESVRVIPALSVVK